MLQRRCRRIILKLIVVAAVIYITSMFVVSRSASSLTNQVAAPNPAGGAEAQRPAVLERPDFDRLRFHDAMRQGAEAERRKREAKNDEKLIQEELARRRAENRRVPPFMMAMSVPNKTSAGKQSSNLLTYFFPGVGRDEAGDKSEGGKNKLDSKMQGLIDNGLLVPKWNIDNEAPKNPNGPGIF